MRSARFDLRWSLALLPLFAGCAMEISPPRDFLRLEGAKREIRLTTPEQARVWVREFEDPDQGEVAFWSAALRNDLVGRRGYTLRDEGDIDDGRGDEGHWASFTTTVDGQPYGYLAALWVDTGARNNTIRIAEFVAPQQEFDERLASVRTALETLRP